MTKLTLSNRRLHYYSTGCPRVGSNLLGGQSPPLRPRWITAIPLLSSCSVRGSLALVLSTPITVHCSRNHVHCPIRRSAPTYRKFHFLRSPEGLITPSAIPQEGTLGIFFDQVLGCPKYHAERPLFSVKTRRSCTTRCYPISRGLTTPKTAVWFFICSARGYIR